MNKDIYNKAHRAALISVSLALSQTPAYTARPQIRGSAVTSRPWWKKYYDTNCNTFSK